MDIPYKGLNMYKTVILEQTEIPQGRCVTCYFRMVVIDENGAIVAKSALPHTVTFMPDADHASILAAINANITTRETDPWPAITTKEWDRAVNHCAIEHTPEIKAAYATFKAQLAAALQLANDRIAEIEKPKE